jgi:hypothetical protein
LKAWPCRVGRRWRRQCGDRGEQHAPVAYGGNADLLQVLDCQVRKDRLTDPVVAERGFVLPETQVLEPGRDVHGRLHSARWDNRLRPVVCKASPKPGRSNNNVRRWCFQLVARMTAFSPFSPSKSPTLNAWLWVDLTHSALPWAMTAVCAFRPKTGVDVKGHGG